MTKVAKKVSKKVSKKVELPVSEEALSLFAKEYVARTEGSTGEKITVFIDKVLAFNTKQIRNAKSKINTIKSDFNDKIEALEDDIEDAEEVVLDAYYNIPDKTLESNGTMKSYIPLWQLGISEAQTKLKVLTDEKVSFTEKKNAELKKFNDLIKLYEARTSQLSAK